VPPREPKSPKLPVPEAASALKHSPFGALAKLDAPPASSFPGRASAPATAPAKAPARLLLRREKKGRGGKTVVVVSGLRAQAHLPESEIAALAQHLKQQLGCGGAVERAAGDTEIVLQGDRPARVAELLIERGFRVGGVTS
jgi:translation initiation factor 1